MHEFETFVYLDIEKTGSSFISQLLRNYSAEKEIRRDHHEPMNLLCDTSKFYFISVRHPLDCYLSLYSFGCGYDGKLWQRLEKANLGKFYKGTTESFNNWLNFVLRPRNAAMLGDGYNRVGRGRIAELVGFQSYRYLRLALPTCERLLAKCETRDDVRRVYAERKLPSFVIRYESFADDLCSLLSGPLRNSIADLDSALEYARSSKRTNASHRIDKGKPDFRLRERLQSEIRRREWFLYETFDY
ncbi:MAG TPA: sulfotransferase family 2 domain-containing protein [Rhizomicrobium sp.]|nr:sulfotransferase family 2 domain-containing protein [Rhizomicrobium sp.]